jgi:hypothetical protein
MRIDRPLQDVLRFEASRESALILAGVLVLVVILWEWLIGGRPLTPEGFRNFGRAIKEEMGAPVFYIVAALPIPLLIWALLSLKVGVFGHSIVFDGQRQVITRNGKIKAHTGEIQTINLEVWDSGTVEAELYLNDGKKVKLGKLCDDHQIHDVIDDIRAFGEVTGNVGEKPPGWIPP